MFKCFSVVSTYLRIFPLKNEVEYKYIISIIFLLFVFNTVYFFSSVLFCETFEIWHNFELCEILPISRNRVFSLIPYIYSCIVKNITGTSKKKIKSFGIAAIYLLFMRC